MAWAGLGRLRADLAANPADSVLAELIAIAQGALGYQGEPTSLGGDRVICPNFRFGDQLIRTIGVVAHFQSPRDVTLAELRVELMYPADDEAEAFFRDAAR